MREGEGNKRYGPCMKGINGVAKIMTRMVMMI
jgi:hypothetical protein